MMRRGGSTDRHAGSARGAVALVLAAAVLLGTAPAPAPAAPVVSAPARAVPRPGPPTVGDSLFPDQGNGGYDVADYAIALRYDATRRTIAASTTVTARAAYPLSSFSLDLEGLVVDRVWVDGHAARWQRNGHKLTVTPLLVTVGRFRVVVDYHGRPVTHIDPDGAKDGWIPTRTGATVLSEPVGAMTWFPVNNTPRDKATYTVAVTVPASLEVAGNGVLTTTRHGATSTWTWRQRQPMASYLAMISIGDYQVFRSTVTLTSGRKIPAVSFVEPELGSLARQRAELPAIVRFQERRFGPYPFDGIGLVAADLKVGYALETQTRPVFDVTKAADLDASLLVHEFAHQWFGDSVTPCDWGDIWLNEGLATYAENVYAAVHGGPSLTAQFRTAYRAADTEWSPAPAALERADQLFSQPVYLRGSMTLDALRQQVGLGTVYTLLRRWADAHAGGCVDTGQFVAAAESTGRRRLDPLFQAWLYVPRRPSGY